MSEVTASMPLVVGAVLASLALGVLVVFAARNVIPRYVGAVREMIAKVRLTRALNGADTLPASDLAPLVLSWLRSDSGLPGSPLIESRIMRIRELYGLLDPGRPQECSPMSMNLRDRQGACLVELAEHVVHLAHDMRPNATIGGRIVDAGELLRFIVSRRDGIDLGALRDKSMRQHVTDRPVSIEQLSELLVAVLLSMRYRQAAVANQEGRRA